MRFRSVAALAAGLLLPGLILPGLAVADLPDLPFDKLLAGPCAEAKAAADCPACTCNPYTQTWSHSSFDDDDEMQNGLAVYVEGTAKSGKEIKRYVAMFGNPTSFTYAGVLADESPPERGQVKVDVTGKTRLMDMCPGMCEHDPVGPVHIFEVSREVTSVTPDPMIWETKEAELIVCYLKDKRPTCWTVPISGSTKGDTLPEGKGKGKTVSKASYSRKWSFEFDKHGAHKVKLTKGTGSGDHMFKESEEFRKGASWYLSEIEKRDHVARLGLR